MASGAKVSDNVKSIYNEMKLVTASVQDRLRLVIFDFIDSVIDVKESYRNSDLEGKDVFEFFKTKLKADMCQYILYDCHFQINSRTKEELVFVMWCHERATIKDRMQYSASKDYLNKIFDGTKYKFEMTDITDCGTRDEFAIKLGKGETVTIVEGKPVKG